MQTFTLTVNSKYCGYAQRVFEVLDVNQTAEDVVDYVESLNPAFNMHDSEAYEAIETVLRVGKFDYVELDETLIQFTLR